MSLKRLQDLFNEKGFVPNNYFTLEGQYKMVEIINFKTAVSLMVIITDKYKISSENVKHEYEMTKKIADTDIINCLADEANIRSSYREIDHVLQALESEDKMAEIYDKQISLVGEESKSIEKFSATLRQMKRFRLCVRNIPYKFALFDDDCVCLLTEDSSIESFYVKSYKNKKRKIFITTTIENFFNTDDIEENVAKINEQFYTILHENQRIETTKIQSMIDSKRNIVVQSNRVLEMKKKLYDKIQKLQLQHSNVIEQCSNMQKKIREYSKGTTISDNNRLAIDRLRTDIAKNEEQQLSIIKDILNGRKELDELCLIVDNILFDNMIMLSKISQNFKLLEMLKIT